MTNIGDPSYTVSSFILLTILTGLNENLLQGEGEIRRVLKKAKNEVSGGLNFS